MPKKVLNVVPFIYMYIFFPLKNTVLQWCGEKLLGPAFAVDAVKLKESGFCPGSHLSPSPDVLTHL